MKYELPTNHHLKKHISSIEVNNMGDGDFLIVVIHVNNKKSLLPYKKSKEFDFSFENYLISRLNALVNS